MRIVRRLKKVRLLHREDSGLLAGQASFMFDRNAVYYYFVTASRISIIADPSVSRQHVCTINVGCLLF